jgi:hypothetical protein
VVNQFIGNFYFASREIALIAAAGNYADHASVAKRNLDANAGL